MDNPSEQPAYSIVIRHWLPIITFCPVNYLPDPIYVSVGFEGTEIVELYAVRAKLRKLLSFKCMFMEEVAQIVFAEFPNASSVHVNLLFNRHSVSLYR